MRLEDEIRAGRNPGPFYLPDMSTDVETDFLIDAPQMIKVIRVK